MLVLAMQFSRGDMTMPRSGERGSASGAIQMDYAFKAEETNTGHCAPTPPASMLQEFGVS
jgi:hypothetical protein